MRKLFWTYRPGIFRQSKAKREDGSSDLYSLFDYKDFREKMDLEKAYLQGRFDAVPYVYEFEKI